MRVGDQFGWVGHVLDGKLSIEAVAGEGGFGVVYRALHVGFQEQVAVKCLKLPQGLGARQKEAFLRSFINEARLMRRLIRATSGVVEALDAGAIVSPAGIWTPYITMEWLAGESLELRLENARAAGASTMSLGEAVEFLWPVAEALSAAHEQGIVHCDIKPANIYLAQMASGVCFKVLDFGIARVMTDIPGIERGGEESSTGMTPRYCAPEQINAYLGPTGPWTDLYSLALVLLEVASGATARKGDTLVDLVIHAMTPKLQPTFASLGIEATPEAEALLAQALALDPRGRGESVVGWWAALASSAGASLPVASRGPRPAFFPQSGAARSSSIPPSGVDETVEVQADESAGRLVRAGEITRVQVIRRGRATSPPEGVEQKQFQEKQFTALMLDLSEWQQLFGSGPPADAERRVSELLDQLVSRIEVAGGVVLDGAADRVLSVFGVPHAHDNDAERALVTALQCAEDAGALRKELGATAAIRGAVHTGRGWWASSGDAIQARGPVVGDALRLLRIAHDGEVVVSDAVRSRVAGAFNVRERSEGAGQGFVVEGKVAVRSPLPRGEFFGVPNPLRGRRGELSFIRDLIAEVVRQRSARWVEVHGAAGVGKTRLLFETTAHLTGSEHTFFLLAARASQQEQSRAFGLLSSLLRARFGLFHARDKGAIAGQIREQLGRWLSAAPPQGTVRSAPDLSALEDDVVILAGLVQEQDADATDDFLSSEPLPRSRVIAAVARVLAALAAAMPVVLLCDDVHLADGSSVELLAELVERLRPEPFFLITSRHDGQAGPSPDQAVAPIRLALGPLAEPDLLDMVHDRTPAQGDFAPIAGEIARRSGGNPALLDELLRLLIDAGVLVRHQGSWLARAELFNPRKIPSSLREVCLARFRLLDPHEQRVLSLAALIGEPFWRGAVGALRAEDPEAPVSDMRLLTDTESVLARLKARGLIEERPRSRVKGDVEYGIIDSTVREVAYERVPSRLLTVYHRAAARWLIAHADKENHASAIANHLEMVGDTGAALREHARAAEHAMRYGQNDQALRVHQHIGDLLSQHALACSSAAGRSSEKNSFRVAGWPSRVAWACARGDVLQRLGRLDEAEATFSGALAAIPGRERRSSEDAKIHRLRALEWTARLDLRRAAAWRLRGDQDRARSLALQAQVVAEQIQSPALLAEACQVLSNVHRRSMELDAAVSAARRGLRACRAIPRARARTELTVDLLRSLGSAFMAARRPVQAERTCKQAMQIADRSGLPRALSFAINDYAAILYLRGRLQEAIPVFLRSLALKERDGDLPQIAIASSNVAEVLLQMQRAPEALGFAQRAEALATRAGAVSDLPEMARNLAEIHLALGQHREATEAATRAVRRAIEHQISVYLQGAVLTAARVLAASPTSPDDPPGPRPLEGLIREVLAAHPAAPWAPEVQALLPALPP